VVIIHTDILRHYRLKLPKLHIVYFSFAILSYLFMLKRNVYSLIILNVLVRYANGLWHSVNYTAL